MSEPDGTKNVYSLGGVITARAFSSILLFIAYLLGYGMGETNGESRGRLLELHDQQQLMKK